MNEFIKENLEKIGYWMLNSGFRIALVVILTVLAIKGVQIVMDRAFSRLSRQTGDEIRKRAETLKSVILHVINFTVLIVAFIMILGELGVEIGPILAAAGVVGVAVGFGAQELVKDVITGFFILMEDQIRVGDVIQVADKGGLVENMNLRIVILRDLSGNVHFVRNSQINIVTNMTKGFSYYMFDIGVAYRENVDEVIDVIKQVDIDLRNDPAFSCDILEPIEILGLDKFADSAIIIKARTKTKPIRQWAVGREFNRRLKIKFDQSGIEIPFPHVTLYAGQPKQGSTTPLAVEIRKNTPG